MPRHFLRDDDLSPAEQAFHPCQVLADLQPLHAQKALLTWLLRVPASRGAS